MPLFPVLRRAFEREIEPKHPSPESADNSAVVNDETDEKAQRRRSKRDFFRHLLHPISSRSESRASRRLSLPVKLQEVEPSITNNVTTPMPNSNKPLPPPPQIIAEEARPSAKSKSPVKLNRIIQPISLEDIHNLFSGAPQFFVRSEGRHTGPPKPSTAFPWNTEVSIRDLCDHYHIEDLAWSSVTAYPHITRDTGSSKELVNEEKEKQRAYYRPICHERPNMLSSQGLERGTIGFSAALEMDVADALYEHREVTPSSGSGSLTERRYRFLNEKRGVRPLTESDVVAKLISLGETYHSTSQPKEKSSVEWYTELFTQVLFPPARVTDSDDPYSLHVQIEALIGILATSNIWIDFSLVEWRIRLGQILWGAPYEPDAETNIPVNIEVHDSGVPGAQKFWLLLQILLSCELLVRLDSVLKVAEHHEHIITSSEVRRFEENASQNVRWSLILARIWLDSIHVDIIQPAKIPEEKKATGGWLATLTGTVTAPTVKDTHVVKVASTEFFGRHHKRQTNGLLHFARKLHWPDADNIAKKFAQNGALIEEGRLGTSAIGTPLSMTTQRSSYFGNPLRPNIKRGFSKQSKRRSVVVQPSGWLSRSYLTGLILPGEGLSHFLISSLLENDEFAVSRLGDEANLYGGFIYQSHGYWSTACIVGRVLAAGKGASQCMGWLSSGVVPEGFQNSWLNIETKMPPGNEGDVGPETARIWKKQTVERDGHVIGNGDAHTALPGDFTLPVDDVRDADHLVVILKSLDLLNIDETDRDTPMSLKSTPVTDIEDSPIISYSATMIFTVKSLGGDTRDMSFKMRYDVRFVTAHPCVPSQHIHILDSPKSLSFQVPNSSGQSFEAQKGPRELYTGHPLHKSFAYKREVLSQILNPSLAPLGTRPLASLHTSSTEVFVVDCNEPDHPSHSPHDAESFSATTSIRTRSRQFGSDLEMLARAWCAERGYNALISRRGRNCVACSIREARALGWKIVLRFG